MAEQTAFLNCYRGRQSALHHMSYLRLSKVYMALQVLREAGVGLDGKSIFDYGFGAGTFYRYCPKDNSLFRGELDEVNVTGVQRMLEMRGHEKVDLRQIAIESWQTHELLMRQYDLILCSHVLEHLPEPVGFLKRIKKCISEGGYFLGVLPLNERLVDPKHEHRVTRELIGQWMVQAGLKIEAYVEGDEWNYWIQPWLTRGDWPYRPMTQAMHLALGMVCKAAGYKAWKPISKLMGTLTFSKPTQAAFLCRDSRG